MNTPGWPYTVPCHHRHTPPPQQHHLPHDRGGMLHDALIAVVAAVVLVAVLALLLSLVL